MDCHAIVFWPTILDFTSSTSLEKIFDSPLKVFWPQVTTNHWLQYWICLYMLVFKWNVFCQSAEACIVQLNQPRLDIQSIGLVLCNATVLYSFHKDPSNKDLTLSWTWSSFKRGTTHPRSSNPLGTKTLKAMRKNVKDSHSKNNKSDQELSWCFSHGTDEDAYTRLSHRVEQRPWEPLQSVSFRVEQAE